MSDQRNGGIAWSEHTWNPVRGCSRVSKGCEHCYAEGVARRFSGPGQPYEGLVRLDADGKAKAQWNGTVRVISEHLGDPLRWTRPRLVFVNSMSDLFHENLAFEAIASIFGVMYASPQHTFQILTKRPERARDFFAWVAERRGKRWREATGEYPTDECLNWARDGFPVLRNAWLGVSVEDQESANKRIPILMELPATVRWVSYEPAIGPLRFDQVPGQSRVGAPVPDWIVVGGESGPGARDFELAWARSVIEQCRIPGVRVFVKQVGARPVYEYKDLSENQFAALDASEDGYHRGDPVVMRLANKKGGDMAEWPEDLRVREWPRGWR